MPNPLVICLGEALVDITPPTRGTSITSTGQMVMAAGGAPANVAVALARLGTASGFLGRVGDDFFGRYLVGVLDQNGVDTSALGFSQQANTGLAFVTWDERGDATYLFYRNPSADTLLAPTDIDPAYLGQAQVLQFGSLLLATEPSASATYHAIKLATETGLLLSYDINLRLTGWPSEAAARTGVSGPLELVQIVKLNRHELEFLTGESDPAAGTQKLWRENFRLIAVTLDSEGCFYRTATASGAVSGSKVQPVDTIGAGDAFMAGLLDELRRNEFAFEDEEVIRRACYRAGAVGALTVTRPGGIPAMPTRAEVEEFLARA